MRTDVRPRSGRGLALARGAALALAALCSACAVVGPEMQRPDVDVPARPSAEAGRAFDAALASRAVAGRFDGARWWSVFKDPVLDRLVDGALRRTSTCRRRRCASRRRAPQRDAAVGGRYPNVEASGLAGRARMSENGIGKALGGGGSGSGSASGSFRRRSSRRLASAPPSTPTCSRPASTPPGSSICAARRAAASRPPTPTSSRPRKRAATRRSRLTAEVARTYFGCAARTPARDRAGRHRRPRNACSALVDSRQALGPAPARRMPRPRPRRPRPRERSCRRSTRTSRRRRTASRCCSACRRARSSTRWLGAAALPRCRPRCPSACPATCCAAAPTSARARPTCTPPRRASATPRRRCSRASRWAAPPACSRHVRPTSSTGPRASGSAARSSRFRSSRAAS